MSEIWLAFQNQKIFACGAEKIYLKNYVRKDKVLRPSTQHWQKLGNICRYTFKCGKS